MPGPMFGAVDDPHEEWPDDTPIDFRVVGYGVESMEPVEYEFHAMRYAPLGSVVDLVRSTDDRGIADLSRVLDYIIESIVPDERDKFRETLDDPSMHFHVSGLVDLSNYLMETRAERPTVPSSGSSGGRTRRATTSRAGASARGSASTRSR